MGMSYNQARQLLDVMEQDLKIRFPKRKVEFHPELVGDNPNGGFIEIFTAYDGTQIRVGNNCVMVSKPGHDVYDLNEDGGDYMELELRPHGTPPGSGPVGITAADIGAQPNLGAEPRPSVVLALLRDILAELQHQNPRTR